MNADMLNRGTEDRLSLSPSPSLRSLFLFYFFRRGRTPPPPPMNPPLTIDISGVHS